VPLLSPASIRASAVTLNAGGHPGDSGEKAPITRALPEGYRIRNPPRVGVTDASAGGEACWHRVRNDGAGAECRERACPCRKNALTAAARGVQIPPLVETLRVFYL